MKNKYLKVGLFILISIFIIIVVFFIYGSIMAIAMQRMPIVEVSKELKKMEKEIQNETNSGASTFFNPIPEYEIEKCDAELSLNLYVNNDSITRTKKILDAYINSVNKRVNEKLLT